jgi:hypothetical protein
MKNATHLVRKYFCSAWKPQMPKHKIVVDLTSYRSPHPVWHMGDAEKVQITHVKPSKIKDYLALGLVKFFRKGFDIFSGYKPGKMTEKHYLRRCIFLETIAGVPGMIGGMMRHLRALRLLREDGGWIHHLLEEAENERMHLLTFLNVRQPGITMRLAIVMSQFFFICFYTPLYIISAKTAFRFVGYLEEEAVKTYTTLIKEIDEGKLPLFKTLKPPKEAISYWVLPENATFRDVIVSIRADEILHREFNHHFADIDPDSRMLDHKYVPRNELKWDDEPDERLESKSTLRIGVENLKVQGM